MKKKSKKIALITGAAKRLGESIATKMALEGWDIIVHYNNSKIEAQNTVKKIKSLGQRAVSLRCDLSKENETKNLISKASKFFGKISCLVNNASVFNFDDCSNFSIKNLNKHMIPNLASPILLTNDLHKMLNKNENATVINILDQKLFNLNQDFLSYTLSKAALNTATLMLARELAPKLRVVGVAPGLTLLSGNQTEKGFIKAHRKTPLGKSSTAEEIAESVCFLASARAITGIVLIVDGGQHLIPTKRDIMFSSE